jgi:hypothetical protein
MLMAFFLRRGRTTVGSPSPNCCWGPSLQLGQRIAKEEEATVDLLGGAAGSARTDKLIDASTKGQENADWARNAPTKAEARIDF